MDVEGANSMNHVIIVTKCTIEKLCEGVLATKVNVADIILKLISLVNESLRRSAEAWSSSLKENISVTQARKAFLPEKFYLINAVKISSLYPYQAYLVRSEITKCILMMSTLKISLSSEKLLKTASDVSQNSWRKHPWIYLLLY